MKRTFLILTAIIMSACAFAQTDTINKRLMPPEINNTDGMNKTDWNNPNNERGTIDNRPNNDQMPTRKENNTTDSTMNKKAMKSHNNDGYIMQNGKMMYSKNGNVTPMVKNYTYPNGTVINTDGSYLSPEGKKSKLNNGQYLDNSGKILLIK